MARGDENLRLGVAADWLGNVSAGLDFAPLASPLLHCVGNPLLDLYWRAARRVQVW